MKICGVFGYDDFKKLWWLFYHQGFLIASFSFYVLITSSKIYFLLVISLNYATICHHKKAMNVLLNCLFLLMEPL
jgi:hypothetical protein